MGPLWIKDPLAIFAKGAERGIVIQDGRIVELVPAGRVPATPDAKTFDAGEHVVLRTYGASPSSTALFNSPIATV